MEIFMRIVKDKEVSLGDAYDKQNIQYHDDFTKKIHSQKDFIEKYLSKYETFDEVFSVYIDDNYKITNIDTDSRTSLKLSFGIHDCSSSRIFRVNKEYISKKYCLKIFNESYEYFLYKNFNKKLSDMELSEDWHISICETCVYFGFSSEDDMNKFREYWQTIISKYIPIFLRTYLVSVDDSQKARILLWKCENGEKPRNLQWHVLNRTVMTKHTYVFHHKNDALTFKLSLKNVA
jgi:hypothetical protein